MEEKSQPNSKPLSPTEDYGLKKLGKHTKKAASTSVVNKYINAAVERQQRTNYLVKPILEQKRTNSLSSRQSLHISTQPSECLSHRSRRIGPSSTSTTVSQIAQYKKDSVQRSNKRA